MPTAALLLALGAAVLHAAWNLLLAREQDVTASAAVALLAAEAVLAPFALVRWHVEDGVWPYVLASGVLEVAYVVLLTQGYQRGELSVVYPLARGVAPVLVLVAGALVLDQRIGVAGALGVLLVSSGVLLVRGARRPAHARSLVFGLATAVTIAGYTLVDDRGIERADAVVYLWLIMLLPALSIPLWLRGRVRRAASVRGVAVGLLSLAAYGLALLALDRADAAPVSAVRETSVLVAVALAALFLRERVTPTRAAGAVLVAAGVAALAL